MEVFLQAHRDYSARQARIDKHQIRTPGPFSRRPESVIKHQPENMDEQPISNEHANADLVTMTINVEKSCK